MKDLAALRAQHAAQPLPDIPEGFSDDDAETFYELDAFIAGIAASMTTSPDPDSVPGTVIDDLRRLEAKADDHMADYLGLLVRLSVACRSTGRA